MFLNFYSMKKKSEGSSGGPSNDDEGGEGEEDETNELKDVMLPKLTHEMSKLGGFFEEGDENKKLRPHQFLNVEIEDCISRMNDLKDEIQVGNTLEMLLCYF